MKSIGVTFRRLILCPWNSLSLERPVSRDTFLKILNDDSGPILLDSSVRNPLKNLLFTRKSMTPPDRRFVYRYLDPRGITESSQNTEGDSR